nr:hypothetical protein [Tanacetum cinerariifolium]
MVDSVSGRAVIDAVQGKHVKYEAKCANIGYDFLPFPFSSLGELEEDVFTLLKRIQKFSTVQDFGARVVVHIFNMIGFTVAKRVEAHIVSRLPIIFLEDHTSDWVRAVPISGLEQIMNGKTYHCIPLFSVLKPCSSCSRVFVGDIYEDHDVSCAGLIGIKHRHNVVHDTLVDICFRSGISAGKEVDIGLNEGVTNLYVQQICYFTHEIEDLMTSIPEAKKEEQEQEVVLSQPSSSATTTMVVANEDHLDCPESLSCELYQLSQCALLLLRKRTVNAKVQDLVERSKGRREDKPPPDGAFMKNNVYLVEHCTHKDNSIRSHVGIGVGLREHLAPMERPDKIPIGIGQGLGRGLLIGFGDEGWPPRPKPAPLPFLVLPMDISRPFSHSTCIYLCRLARKAKC